MSRKTRKKERKKGRKKGRKGTETKEVRKKKRNLELIQQLFALNICM